MPAFAWGLRREASVLGAACGSTESCNIIGKGTSSAQLAQTHGVSRQAITEAVRRYKAVRLGAAS